MSKLEQYITEARNIKSEEAKIKKLVTNFFSETEKRKNKMKSDVMNIMESVSNSLLDIPSFRDFRNDVWKQI